MGLKERITEDMKSAMKAKEAQRLLTIRGLLAALKQKEVDERVVLDDVAIVAIIDRLIKQRRDSIAQFTQGNRMDLVEKESAELGLLQSYLPHRMSQDELLVRLQSLAQELGSQTPADLGKLMAAAKTQLAGQADMSMVLAAAKQVLAGAAASAKS